MFARTLRNGLFATAAAGALMIGFNVTPASATALPFQVDPNYLATGGPYSNVTATDINGTSDSLIQITGPNTQTETGWVQLQSLADSGGGISFGLTRLATPGTGLGPSFYSLYITFSGTVTGIGGIGGNNQGNVTNYSFQLWADRNPDDVFSAGTTGASPTAPSITNTGNDILLAVGNSVSGTAGFINGVPFFHALANFILCDGTAGQGQLGGVTVSGGAAAACQLGQSGLQYFVSPVPFYALDFNSSIAASGQNLTIDPTLHGNATLNNLGADINFVPEPTTLSIFGMGMLALAAFTWRRKKDKGATA